MSSPPRTTCRRPWCCRRARPPLHRRSRRPDDPVNALPFAAGLVAGGVPVVIAMAGDISDTACRVFTRALTQAIGHGVPSADAVIRGRGAAFHARPDLDSADWALPAVFLAERLPADIRLVDTAAIKAMRQRIFDLNLGWDPVFCGRGEFIDAMDRLLDGSDPLNVLVAYTQDPAKSYGGLRLLQELAARAVRAGCFPVLLGPYDQDPPPGRAGSPPTSATNSPNIRANLGIPKKEGRLSSRWRNQARSPCIWRPRSARPSKSWWPTFRRRTQSPRARSRRSCCCVTASTGGSTTSTTWTPSTTCSACSGRRVSALAPIPSPSC